MTSRTVRKSMTFSAPFQLAGFEALLPAGTYVVETDEEAFEGHVHTAFRRTATTLRIRAGAAIEYHDVDPKDLEAALRRDQHAERDGLAPADTTRAQPQPSGALPPKDWRWVPLWVRNMPDGRR